MRPGASETPTVAKLQRYVAPVKTSLSCKAAMDILLADTTLSALPIVDLEDRPVGLIERHAFVEFFARSFTAEIYGKTPLSNLMSRASVISQTPIVVESDTSVDDVAKIIIDAGMHHMVTGFIVTRDGAYLGVANGHDLLNYITTRKQSDLYQLAHFDHLTGLANRLLFLDRLTHAILDAKRQGSTVGLLLVDLDRFKVVNDSLGHPSGDALLRVVAERLSLSARETDTVARLGGDEFAVVMTNIGDASGATSVAQRIQDSLKAPFDVFGHPVIITASIGIALSSLVDESVDGLLAKADAAMYEVKGSGRDGYRQYEAGLARLTSGRMTLETELRTAIDRDELVLFYQPQIDAHDLRVTGVEALIRWRHRDRGILSPLEFLGLAEESGLIVKIGAWVVARACHQHGEWVRAGHPPLRVAVNVSALQFAQPDFCTVVSSAILESGISPEFLELELTESVVMQDSAAVLKTLRALKDMGVRLAIDDFGTGFSSLSYLRTYPIDVVKIDQSFVRDIDKLQVNESIIKAIVMLAHSLGLSAIAEGVETGGELRLLTALGCDAMQGYWFSRPLPAEDLPTSLSNYRGPIGVDRNIG